ncbi:MAG TPA: SpoIID/LytB domain-containing protein, partial [Candidatus Saccharimonadales bacterium]|nr:SpoIID/LytB domain-containing protein [Candidatus Saccharimonadales bacterium]
KAQAIAARSYAMAVTNNGSSTICPSQSCQVVKKELNSDSWVQAVNDTAGQVLTSGGSPIKAWFSSTAGGYTFSSADVFGGSTSYTRNSLDAAGSVNSFSDLQNNAYDKASPWFYCDWGSRSAYNGTAWLKSDEVADIVNVLLLAKADSSTQKHLSQTDKPNPDGVDTWDAARVKQELQSRGITPLDSASDVSISADFGSGRTSTVSINGQSFSGSDFKNYFNLRAPANINIVGPLYNVEKR